MTQLKNVIVVLFVALAMLGSVAQVMAQGGATGAITGIVQDPVSYTHLTLPTNREV